MLEIDRESYPHALPRASRRIEPAELGDIINHLYPLIRLHPNDQPVIGFVGWAINSAVSLTGRSEGMDNPPLTLEESLDQLDDLTFVKARTALIWAETAATALNYNEREQAQRIIGYDK